MLLFPVYAALVWYGCYRWRRQFLGYASLLVGAGAMLAMMQLELLIERWLRADNVLLKALLITEAGFILLVGCVVVRLPRERVQEPCPACNYELAGLEAGHDRCPECGVAREAAAREAA